MTTKTDLSRLGPASAYLPDTAPVRTTNHSQDQAHFEACLKPETQRPTLTEVKNFAALSMSAYYGSGAPAGWQRLSDTGEQLVELGLNKAIFEDKSSGSYAALYRSTADGQQYVLAFRGSDSAQDYLGDNIPQSRGKPTPQYSEAMALARAVAVGTAPRLTITGHSLGGGLAAAASVASGAPAVTFNAAGLHPATVERYGFALDTVANERIVNYHFQHELLSAVQNNPFIDAVAALTATPLEYGENVLRLLLDQPRRDWRPAYVPAAAGRQVALSPVDRQGRLLTEICQQRQDSLGLHSLQRVIDALDYCLDDAEPDSIPSAVVCPASHMRY